MATLRGVARAGSSLYGLPHIQRASGVRSMSHKAAFLSDNASRRSSGRGYAVHASPLLSSARRRATSAAPSTRSLYASRLIVGGTTRNISLWPFASARSSSEQQPETVSGDAIASEAQTATNVQKEHSIPEFPSSETLAETAHEAQDAMVHATEQVQTLADMGALSWWPNVRAAQAMFDWLVEATGMPWWLTIAAVVLSVRVLILPGVLYGQKNAIRLANIQPRMQTHMNDIQYAKSTGDQALLMKSVQSVQTLMRDNDCHPLRSLIVPLIQAPIFMTFFFALRGLGEAGLTTMKTGGLAWFTDLTAADPYFILPVLSSAVMLLTIETGAEIGTAGGQAQNTQQAVTMRWVLRVLAVVAIPFMYHFPAAVFCYMITNGVLSLVQLLALNAPFVRRSLRLPERVQESKEDKLLKQHRKGEKQMGFWDAVGTGMTSQENPATVRVVRRNQVPSALQNQRGMNESRERALKHLQSSEKKRKN